MIEIASGIVLEAPSRICFPLARRLVLGGEGHAALPILLEAFASLPEAWTLDDPPAGVERGDWERARVRAVAAAINLSRADTPNWRLAATFSCSFTTDGL
ncbi:MAG: hypothetical protein HY720_00380 [Planctomycetes bacterium]|nr:hypothetical protein [Planctomycetota bacterium]